MNRIGSRRAPTGFSTCGYCRLLPLREDLVTGLDGGDVRAAQVTGGLVGVEAVDGQVAQELAGAAVDDPELEALLDVVGGAEGDGGVPDARDVLGGPDDAAEVLAAGGDGRRGAGVGAAGDRRA